MKFVRLENRGCFKLNKYLGNIDLVAKKGIRLHGDKFEIGYHHGWKAWYLQDHGKRLSKSMHKFKAFNSLRVYVRENYNTIFLV